MAEGLHLAGEALAAGADLESALVSPRLFNTDEGREIARRLESAGVPLFEIADTVMETVSDTRTPQPVVVVTRRPVVALQSVVASAIGAPLVVVAHGLQDPGNLGTVLRTADAAGATGFVITGDGADLYHPKTVRATMGSIFRLQAVVSPLEDLVTALRAAGIATIGTDASSSEPYHTCDLRGPVALFFGREAHGLPAELTAVLDHRVRIPMRPGVDSLSVGAAAAVCLYEARRQRD